MGWPWRWSWRRTEVSGCTLQCGKHQSTCEALLQGQKGSGGKSHTGQLTSAWQGAPAAGTANVAGDRGFVVMGCVSAPRRKEVKPPLMKRGTRGETGGLRDVKGLWLVPKGSPKEQGITECRLCVGGRACSSAPLDVTDLRARHRAGEQTPGSSSAVPPAQALLLLSPRTSASHYPGSWLETAHRGARCPLSVWVFLVLPCSLFAFLTHLTSSLLPGFFLQINHVSHSLSSKFVIFEGSPNDLHFLHLLSLAGLMTFSWLHCTVFLPLTVKGQKHMV